MLIIELGKKFDTDKTGVIAENKEKNISFNVGDAADTYEVGCEVKQKKIQLRFIAGIRFMASSLDSLTNNLGKGGHYLSGFEDYYEKQYELLIRKGVYRYEHTSN